MKIRQYDEDLSADDFVFEEKRRKLNQLKEKKTTKPILLDKLPQENDVEVKSDN